MAGATPFTNGRPQRKATDNLGLTVSIALLTLGVGPAALVQTTHQGESVIGEVGAADSVAPHRDDGPFFYFGLPYGSDATAGPLDVILNKGFSVAQLSNFSRRIFDYPYGWGAVEESVLHPVEVIERWGWERTIERHVLPLTWDISSMSWATNYVGHLIEGGITNRRLSEWFDARGVPLPGLFAAITSLTASVLNEAYESPGIEAGYPSMVVDLLLFDPGGILLFTNDAVARFFFTHLEGQDLAQPGRYHPSRLAGHEQREQPDLQNTSESNSQHVDLFPRRDGRPARTHIPPARGVGYQCRDGVGCHHEVRRSGYRS